MRCLAAGLVMQRAQSRSQRLMGGTRRGVSSGQRRTCLPKTPCGRSIECPAMTSARRRITWLPAVRCGSRWPSCMRIIPSRAERRIVPFSGAGELLRACLRLPTRGGTAVRLPPVAGLEGLLRIQHAQLTSNRQISRCALLGDEFSELEVYWVMARIDPPRSPPPGVMRCCEPTAAVRWGPQGPARMQYFSGAGGSAQVCGRPRPLPGTCRQFHWQTKSSEVLVVAVDARGAVGRRAPAQSLAQADGRRQGGGVRAGGRAGSTRGGCGRAW